VLHQLGRLLGVIETFGPVEVLADADDDGGAGIESHDLAPY
jgi:hypothetical protein